MESGTELFLSEKEALIDEKKATHETCLYNLCIGGRFYCQHIILAKRCSLNGGGNVKVSFELE